MLETPAEEMGLGWSVSLLRPTGKRSKASTNRPPPTDMFASNFEPVVEIPGLYHPKSSIGLLDISNDVLLESVADRMQPAAAIAQGLFGFPWGLPAREIFAWELMTDGRWDQTCHGVTLPDGQRLYLSVHLEDGACCPCGLMVLAVYRGSDPEEADTRLLQLFQSTRGAVIGIKRCIGVRPGGGYWGEGDQVEFV